MKRPWWTRRIYLRGMRELVKFRVLDTWSRLKWWLPGGVCVFRNHNLRGQFCIRCGEFLP